MGLQIIITPEMSHNDDVDEHDSDHAEHVMHQIHNRPYSALYVAAFFLYDDCSRSISFLCYSDMLLKQVGLQYYLESWKAITSYLLPGAINCLAIALWAWSTYFYMDGS